MLNYASSKVDYSVGYGIYMLPSNMNLNIGANVSGYNNEILISKSNFSLGVNSVVKVNVNAKLSETKLSEHKKAHIVKPVVKLTKSKSTNVKSTSSSITHEEEKVALILLLTAGFTIWWMLK